MKPSDRVIERFMAVFGEPKTPNPELFIDEYEKAITGYDAEALDAAATYLLRRSTFWPKPGELIERAEEFLAERDRANDAKRNRPFDADKQFAIASMRSRMAKEAAKDGWIGELYDFCRKTGRLPSDREASFLAAQQREFDRIVAGLETKKDDLGVALYRLGVSFSERAKQLTEIVDGERSALSPIDTGWPG